MASFVQIITIQGIPDNPADQGDAQIAGAAVKADIEASIQENFPDQASTNLASIQHTVVWDEQPVSAV